MDGEAGLRCPQCSAARDIYRYCMNCGFDYSGLPDELDPPTSPYGDITPAYAAEPVSDVLDGSVVEADTAERPAVATQPVLPPPIHDEPMRIVGGRSAPVILGLVAAAVFVLILIGAAIVSLIGSGDDDPEATDSEPSSQGPSDDPASPDAAGPTCWNGTQVAGLSECPDPSGTDGLAWVFPSFDPQECTMRRENPAKWNCTVETAEGDKVRIRYREHKGVERALTAYTAKYGLKNRTEVLSAREDIERYVWQAPRPNNNGVWAISSMYAEYPWSVTIKGQKSDAVEAAFNDDVEFRNPRRLAGSPAEG